MVSRREHFQRVYDLRERVLPGRYDGHRPSAKSANRALVAKAAKSLGIATEAWIADYYRMRRSETAEDEARRMQHEAEDYCDQKLASFQVVLERVGRAVSQGRLRLSADRWSRHRRVPPRRSGSRPPRHRDGGPTDSRGSSPRAVHGRPMRH